MRNVLLLFLLFFSYALKGQSPATFTFGNNSHSLIGHVGLVDGNGAYILVGNKYVNDASGNGSRPFISKFSANHIEEWSYTIDDLSFIGSTVIQAQNNDYIVTWSSGVSSIIQRVSPNGNVLWHKKYTNISNLEGLYEDTNEDIYVSGGRLSNQVVQKIDKNGSILWCKSFDANSNYFFGRGIAETQSGDIVIAGSATYVNNGLNNKIVLNKVSKTGQLIWGKEFSCPTNAITCNDLALSSKDQSFMLVGYTGLNTNNDLNAISIKIDSNGDYVNNQELGYLYTDQYNSIVEVKSSTTDHLNFVAVGNSKPTQVCGGNVFFTLLNNNNDTVKNNIYGNPAGTGAQFTSIHNSNYGLHAFGSGSLFGYWNGGAEIQCLRIDNNLNLPCNSYQQTMTQVVLTINQSTGVTSANYTPNVDTNYSLTSETNFAANACLAQPLSVNQDYALSNQLRVYPNPGIDNITVEVADAQSLDVNVLSLNGTLLFAVQKQTNKIEIATEHWAPGIYLVQVRNEKGYMATQKILIR